MRGDKKKYIIIFKELIFDQQLFINICCLRFKYLHKN